MLISLGAASASDINNTVDDQVLSATPTVDTLSFSVNTEQENDTMSVQSDNGLLAVAENNNILGDSNTGSSDDFTELVKLSTGTLDLTQDYYFTSTVNIGKSLIINGNEHTITGSDCTIFNINANNVVINNLNFNNTQTATDFINWNGDNGQINNAEFINISSTNIINWNGNNGQLNTVDFINFTTSKIINWTGDYGKIKNIKFKNNINNQNFNLDSTGINFYADNITGDIAFSKNYYFYWYLQGENATVINSHFNKTVIDYALSVNVINSSFNNTEINIFRESEIINPSDGNHINPFGAMVNAYGCNFTNCASVFSETRKIVTIDHCNIINSTLPFNQMKMYWTLKNSHLENITGSPMSSSKGIITGGFQLYNVTIKNASSTGTYGYMFSTTSGAGNYPGALLDNVTLINSNMRQTLFYVNEQAFTVKNSNFTNNTMVTGWDTNQKGIYMYNNSFIGNTITSTASGGDYFIRLRGNNLYFEDNNFTDNKGFKTYTVTISGTNYYKNNIFSNNLNRSGVDSGMSNTTALNTYVYRDFLYVDNHTNGNGSKNNRSNWTYAVDNIAYGGTIYLAPGTYNDIPATGLYFNFVGEEYGSVIFNKSGYFNTYLYEGTIENITFNNTNIESVNSVIRLFTTNVHFQNCIFDNITESNKFIFYSGTDGYSYSIGHTFKNLTIKNSNLDNFYQKFSKASQQNTASSYVFYNITVIDSVMNNFLQLSAANGFDITLMTAINSTFNKEMFYIANVNLYGDVPYAVNRLSDINVINCTHNVVVSTTHPYQRYFIDDVTVKNSIINSNASALFNGCNLELTNLVCDNLTNMTVNLIKFTNDDGLCDYIDLNKVNVSYLITNNLQSSFNNVNLSNVNIAEGIFDGSVAVSRYDNLNFTNVTILNADDVIFTLNKDNVLSGSVFDNVTGHILVSGDYTIIKDVEFKNMNNSGLNGSCIFVNANFVDLSNLIFTGNTASNGAIYITKSSIRPSLTGSTFKDNIAVNAGGALYIQESTDDFYMTIDDSTSLTINQTSESKMNLGRVNGMGGNIDFSSLVTEVYVTNDSSAISNDGKSWSTPTVFIKAYGMAGKNCIFHFVEDNIFNYSEYHGSYVVSTGDDGWNFIGNNTTIIGLKFVVMSDHSLYASNITFKDTNDSAVTVNGDHVEFKDCAFINATGSAAGYGALIINASDVNITNCDFINNTIDDANELGLGAGIYINGSNIKLDNCHFENNTANDGAHIYLDNDQELITIINTKFINGSSIGSYNSNVRLSGDNVVVYNNTFQYNNFKYALGLEGVMRLFNVSSNTFMDNLGGGLYTNYINNVAQLNYLRDNNFTNNSASNGGAWFIKSVDNYLDTQGTKFDNNTASNGGAIYIDADGVKLSDFNFTNNSASNGGAVYINKDNIILSGMSFIGNNATNGGALYVNGNNTRVINSIFKNNNASEYGSAVYLEDNQIISLSNIQLINNKGKYDNPSDMKYDDISYAYILPGINGNLIVDRGEDNVYHINRTAITSYSEVYITNDGTGTGGIMDPTNWENAITKILKDGIIYIVTDNFKVNNEMIELLEDANLTNVTIVGINKTKITRDSDAGKYLFINLK